MGFLDGVLGSNNVFDQAGDTISGAFSSNGQQPGFFGQGMYGVQDTNNPVIDQSISGYNTGTQQLLNAANQQAPTIAPTVTSGGVGTEGETNVANQLYGIGTGKIEGAAAKTAALQGTQEQAANLSAMGSARGTANPALANYNLGQQNANVRNQVAQNAVTGAAQEQLGALSGAAGAYGAVQQNQQFNAGQINQRAMAQAQLQGQQMGLQGQELAAYVQANAGQIANQMTAQLGTQSLMSGAYNNAAGNSLGGKAIGLLGGVAGGIGAAMMSDRKSKKNVKPADKEIDKFLKSVRKVSRK